MRAPSQIVAIALTAITLATSCVHVLARSARVTVHICDEGGRAVTGANTRVLFSVDEGIGAAPNYRQKEGLSSADGTFVAAERCDSTVSVSVEKGGYYRSEITRVSVNVSDGSGGWVRTNPVIRMVLIPVEEPTPMYARKIQGLRIPVLGQALGFDFIAADWVQPHGSGTTSDALFTVDRNSPADVKNFRAKVRIEFPGEGNGVIRIVEQEIRSWSALRLPRSAPEVGYANSLALYHERQTGVGYSSNIRRDLGYFMKLRTKRVGDELRDSLFGKIDGDFDIDVVNSETADLYFTYYVNPTPNDRNLEFDPNRNLFKNLDWNEEVRAP